MATRPIGAEIQPEPDFRTTPAVKPPWMGPLRIEKIFDEYENEPLPMPMPRQHMLADAGDDSPALMEIAQILSTGSPQVPARIDLSGMPGPRGRGEVTRFDLERMIADLEPQTVNREAKRDREDVREISSMPKGIAREALGQAMLLGYGDDIEGFLTGRAPDDIRAERNAWGDQNPATSLGSYVGGLAAGGAGPKILKWLSRLGRGGADVLEDVTPRNAPDLRQAMRNAEGVEQAAKSSDDIYDDLQRLLSNPEARLDIQGKPLELSPSQIFTMTAGAAPGAGPVGTRENPLPETAISEHDTSRMSPIDRLRLEAELQDANGMYLTEDEKAANARTNVEAVAGALPIVGNMLSARDAFQGAENAGAAFSAGDTRQGIIQSALASLSALGAVTGLPTSKAAGAAARGASSRAGVFVPVEDARKIDDVLSRRSDDVPLREIYHDTGAFIDPSGRVLREIPDSGMETGMGRFKPGDQATLGEYADHPIFEQFPQYRDMPVTFTDAVDIRGGAPIARTLPEGGAELSLAPGDPRKGVAKVLQYNIAQDTGMSPSLRHGKGELLGALERAPQSLRGVTAASKVDLDALAAYVDSMTNRRAELMRNLEMVDPKKGSTLAQIEANKNAGNVNARVVAGRTMLDSQGVKQIYPYNKQTPYFKRGQGRGITDFEDMFALPPEGLDDKQLMEFLRAWRMFGSGRPSGG